MFVDLNRATVAFRYLFQIALGIADDDREQMSKHERFKACLQDILGVYQPSEQLTEKLYPVYEECLKQLFSRKELLDDIRKVFIGERHHVISFLSILIRMLSSEEGAMTQRDRLLVAEAATVLQITEEELVNFTDKECAILESCVLLTGEERLPLTDLQKAYELLGCGKDTSMAEVKRSYRILAKQFHPDVSPLESSTETSLSFHDIQEAYELIVRSKMSVQRKGC